MLTVVSWVERWICGGGGYKRSVDVLVGARRPSPTRLCLQFSLHALSSWSALLLHKSGNEAVVGLRGYLSCILCVGSAGGN